MRIVTLTNLSRNQSRESVHLALFALRVGPTPINTNKHLQRRGIVCESGCRDEVIMNKTNKQSSSYRPFFCKLFASIFSGDGVCWLVGWLVSWLVDWLVGWLVGWLVSWLVVWLVG